MQQWLDVIQATSNFLAFAAALTNLTIAITSRRTPSGRRSPSGVEN
ncbi:hypothetical protein [Micromonospora endolithica]|nr:hypothetical protein [Micromonospora endolithica]TWJ21066.1 hypothetical protein JD76_01166 [Micromonospora endolithica]